MKSPLDHLGTSCTHLHQLGSVKPHRELRRVATLFDVAFAYRGAAFVLRYFLAIRLLRNPNRAVVFFQRPGPVFGLLACGGLPFTGEFAAVRSVIGWKGQRAETKNTGHNREAKQNNL